MRGWEMPLLLLFSLAYIQIGGCIPAINTHSQANAPFSQSSDLTLNYERKGNYSLYMNETENLDSSDRPNLEEFWDFEPTKHMEQLIQIAESNAVPPTLLHKELKKIIQFHPADLVAKYKISVNPKVVDRNTTTITRLTIMFPHYYGKFYERIHIHGNITEPNCLSSLWEIRPRVIDHPEFGGLIPHFRSGKMLPDIVRSAIIRVHAYTLLLCKGSILNTIDRVSLELKERINKSHLSNEHRIRLLKRFGIITKDEYTNPVIAALFTTIPPDITRMLESVVLEVST